MLCCACKLYAFKTMTHANIFLPALCDAQASESWLLYTLVEL